MSERREIARGADGALARDDGIDLAFQQAQQRIDDDRPHPRARLRQAVDLERRGEAHGVVAERRPGAGAVREDEIVLQLFELVRRDRDLRQLAESGIDAVDRHPLANDARDDGGAVGDRASLAVAEGEGDRRAGDAAQIGEAELAWLQGDGLGFGADWHAGVSQTIAIDCRGRVCGPIAAYLNRPNRCASSIATPRSPR